MKSEQLKLGEGHPSDIVILIPNNDRGLMAAKNFIKENIEINHVFEDDHEKKYHRNKKSFWSGDSRLKISTIHSFKGWEALHVILLIPEKWNLRKLDVLVYTAMTIGRENLIVHNYEMAKKDGLSNLFRETLGISECEFEEEKMLQVNSSLSAEATIYLSRFNKLDLTNEEHGKVIELLRYKFPEDGSRLIHNKMRKRLLKHFKRPSKFIANRLGGGEKGFYVDEAKGESRSRVID